MKHKTYLIGLIILSCIFSSPAFAQIAINDDGSSADPSAILDVNSNTKGVLIPRMTSGERTAIPSPAMGLMVYDTDTNSFWYFETTWKELGASSSSSLWYENSGNIIHDDLANKRIGIGTDTVFSKMHIVGGIDDVAVLRVDGHPDFNEPGNMGPIGITARCYGPGVASWEGGIGGVFNAGSVGIMGAANSLWGVFGHSRDVAGVYGSSDNFYGVHGIGDDGPAGVYGQGSPASPGVKGEGSTGVLGHGTHWGVFGYNNEPYSGAEVGVRGTSKNFVGVLGHTQNAASYAGYFVGDVFSSGSYIGSDQMLKQNIAAIQSPLAIIAQLQPKSYQYRRAQFQEMNLPEGQRYGLIAQDVAAVLPRLVKNTKVNIYDWDKLERDIAQARADETVPPSTPDLLETVDFKAVNYTELIPILLAGVQEQQDNLQNLTETNAALQTELNQLKEANANLDAELQSLKQAVQQLLQEDNQ